MQICTLTQTHNHVSIPPFNFLQARCPSCHPTNNVKALKALKIFISKLEKFEIFAKIQLGIQISQTFHS